MLSEKNNACIFYFHFSVPDEISDVAAAEMAEADQPPADCEEEKNPYNGDGWDKLKIFPFIQF